METQSIDLKNQWTGFYIITAPVMKNLNTKVKVFHESISPFMKSPGNCIS